MSAPAPDSARLTSPGGQAGNAWSNWAGNQRVTAVRVARPTSPEEVSATIRAAVADGADDQAHRRRSLLYSGGGDRRRAGASRRAGRRRGRRSRAQTGHRAGRHAAAARSTICSPRTVSRWPNLGDIDVQTISGAISTGTHGTGAKLGCLSTFVVGLRYRHRHRRHPDRCSATEHPDVFQAARVGVGALGIITEVTLQCVDAFTLRADERPGLLRDAFGDLESLIAENDHFEMYWFPYTDRVQIKRNNRVPVADQPLPRLKGWLDDDFLPNTVFGGVCRIGPRGTGARAGDQPAVAARACPHGSIPTAPTASSARRGGCGSPKWSTGCPARRCRRRSRRSGRSSTGCRSRSRSRSRSGSPPPTTSGSPTGTGGRARTSRSTSSSACRTSRTCRRSRRSRPNWAAGRTGASCTGVTPTRCGPSIRGSTTSWPYATGSTRTARSPTTTRAGSSAT